MKKIWKIGILIVCMFLPMTVCAAETQEEIAEEITEQFDFSELDEMMEEIFPREKMNVTETISALIEGDMTWSFEVIKQLIADQFTYELSHSRESMMQIMVLVVVAAVFANFSGVFKSTQVSEISFTMLYMFLIAICLNNFRILAEAAGANIGKLIEFMKLLGPVYFFAVALATGSSTSVTFYQFLLILVFLVELVILNFLVPMTQLYLIMRILGEFSPEVKLSEFSNFLETIISWTLKTMMTGVIGINLIQSMLTPAIDSVKRSVMTRSGEAIPIIGNLVGGTAEVVLGTAVLIKNGIGVIGMVTCLGVCVGPIFQMGITSLLYHLVAALIQPISDKRLVSCIRSMADACRLLLRIVFTTGVVFLLTIAVVATTAGG